MDYVLKTIIHFGLILYFVSGYTYAEGPCDPGAALHEMTGEFVVRSVPIDKSWQRYESYPILGNQYSQRFSTRPGQMGFKVNGVVFHDPKGKGNSQAGYLYEPDAMFMQSKYVDLSGVEESSPIIHKLKNYIKTNQDTLSTNEPLADHLVSKKNKRKFRTKLVGGRSESIEVELSELEPSDSRLKNYFSRKGEKITGLFKPFQEGDHFGNYRNEVLAYQIDRLFGFDLVPPTIVREFNGRVGSLQFIVKGAKRIDEYDGVVSKNDLEKQSLFDFIIDNRDRHLGNRYVDEYGKVISIDNGQSFGGNGGFPQDLNKEFPRILKFLKTSEGKKIRKAMAEVDQDKLREEMTLNIGQFDTERFMDRLNFLLEVSK